MMKDNPDNVLLMKMRPFSDDQFYVGENCLSML